VKDILVNINKLFENRYRLAVMSLLMVNDAIDFNTLKQQLDLTDGNLASHLAALEKQHYIDSRKESAGSRTVTYYSATGLGKQAFTDHLDALEKLIRNSS
jgi:DNA-binding MarR family transcriptional regulator